MKVFNGDCSWVSGGEPLPPLWITEIAGIGKGQQHSSLDTHQNGTCCSNCCHCSCSCCPVWPVSHKACSLICACPGVCFACSAGKSPSSPWSRFHNAFCFWLLWGISRTRSGLDHQSYLRAFCLTDLWSIFIYIHFIFVLLLFLYDF